jgi:hypothetical protein
LITYKNLSKMANSDMVAIEGSGADKQRMPKIDKTSVVQWTKDIYMYLMFKNRNHKGFDAPPVLVGNAVAARATWEKLMDIWLERKDTCVSTIYVACQEDCDATAIVAQYMLEKEMLPDGHANKETSASELRDRLLNRFRGELQDELGELSKKYTSFAMIPQEKVCSGIDRLNTIVQKMTELNQPPSDASTLAVLRNALQIPSLKSLWLAIALNPNPTYVELMAVCKRYDVATRNEALLDEVNFVTPDKGKKRDRSETDAADCSFCGKPGHVADKCFSRIKERKAAQLKRANRAREKENAGLATVTGQKPGSKAYSGCHGCGSKKHVKANCPKSKDKDKANKSKKGGKKGLEQYVRQGEDSDSDSDED